MGTQLIIQIDFFPDYLKAFGASKFHLQRDFVRTCYNINYPQQNYAFVFTRKTINSKISAFLENYLLLQSECTEDFVFILVFITTLIYFLSRQAMLWQLIIENVDLAI